MVHFISITLFVEDSRVLQEDMSCCRGPNRTVPTQLGVYSQQLIAQLSIICASETGCVASLLLCLLLLKGAWNLRCQIRAPAGLSIHKISHEVTQLLDIKSQRGWGGAESMNHQDVFLPWHDKTACSFLPVKHCPNSATTSRREGKEEHRCICCFSASTCDSFTSVVQLDRKRSRSGYDRLPPDTHFSCYTCECFPCTRRWNQAGQLAAVRAPQHGGKTERKS